MKARFSKTCITSWRTGCGIFMKIKEVVVHLTKSPNIKMQEKFKRETMEEDCISLGHGTVQFLK